MPRHAPTDTRPVGARKPALVSRRCGAETRRGDAAVARCGVQERSSKREMMSTWPISPATSRRESHSALPHESSTRTRGRRVLSGAVGRAHGARARAQRHAKLGCRLLAWPPSRRTATPPRRNHRSGLRPAGTRVARAPVFGAHVVIEDVRDHDEIDALHAGRSQHALTVVDVPATATQSVPRTAATRRHAAGPRRRPAVARGDGRATLHDARWALARRRVRARTSG
jgi:hypothetical protein